MIWDMHLVHCIEGLRSQLRTSIDAMVLARHPEDIQAIQKQELEYQFREAAKTYGVDLDSRDLHIKYEEEDGEYFNKVVIMRMRWWPEVTEVQLVGGPADGNHYTLDQKTFDYGQLNVAFPEPFPWDEIAHRKAIEPTAIQHHVTTYRIMGWHEEARFWTMQPIS